MYRTWSFHSATTLCRWICEITGWQLAAPSEAGIRPAPGSSCVRRPGCSCLPARKIRKIRGATSAISRGGVRSYRSFLDTDGNFDLGQTPEQKLPPLASFQHDGSQGPFSLTSDFVDELIGAKISVVGLPATCMEDPL